MNMLNNDIFNSLPYFIFIIKNDETILYANLEAHNVFGNALIGKKVKEALGVKEGYDFVRAKSYGVNKIVFSINYKGKWFEVHDIDINWEYSVSCRLITGVEITDLKISEEKLIIEAYTDSMTQTYNKQFGIDFLEKQIDISKTTGQLFTVCYVDLDDLKCVNDTYGHTEGDKYIKTVVSLIRKMKRKNDIIARMGGDEFLLIFPSTSYSRANNILKNVTASLNELNKKFIDKSGSNAIRYSISYGILEVSDRIPLDLEYIVNTIDNNMYYMKDEHKRRRIHPNYQMI